MEIIFYRNSSGDEPAKDFISAQNVKMRAKIARTILLLETNGIALREPFSKCLEDGIFELRVQMASDICRILYFFYIGNVTVLTNGFVKKSQQTPRSEIEKAKLYRNDFLKNMDVSNDKI